MVEKLEFIDEFLTRCEDWMHGQDGTDVTMCRKYINEILNQLETKNIDIFVVEGILESYGIPVFNTEKLIYQNYIEYLFKNYTIYIDHINLNKFTIIDNRINNTTTHSNIRSLYIAEYIINELKNLNLI